MNTGFQAANERIDEIKIKLKDLIKCYETEGKDRVRGVEDDFGKVLGRVGNVEGKVDTVEHSMYHFMEAALDKQDGGRDKSVIKWRVERFGLRWKLCTC